MKITKPTPTPAVWLALACYTTGASLDRIAATLGCSERKALRILGEGLLEYREAVRRGEIR